MTNKLIVFFIFKYLRFDKTQPFITVTAILAFLGVGIGVMVLLVAMAIMNGMTKEFEKKLFVMNYPLSLFATSSRGVGEGVVAKLEEKFPDLLFSPYLQMQVVVRKGSEMSAGMIFGVDMQKESKINEVFQKAFVEQKEVASFPLIVGRGLYDKFLLELEDKLTLFFTKLEPTGLVFSPVMKRFNVSGVFDSGLKAYDVGYMYTDFASLAKIRNIPSGVYDGIHIYSAKPMEDIHKIREALQEIPHYGLGIEGWWQQNGNFFAAMAMEKRALFIVLMLIVLMASLNIISSLLMVIMNRRKEIALLLSMGASQKEIKSIFFWLGNVIGFGGIVFGVILAGICMYILSTFPIISLPADVYGITKLPLDLAYMDFIGTLIGSFLIVSLSSYYPARRASKIDALQVLRNE
ncbi:FtsX-like permease family protein [Helicobacter anatolicus]|uniref:FtsX-like permease family protein n=1 Tax=Helicobacter anatolicus TaxID=2905874 RepID=UPI001E5C3CCE|nr:ABC transporter permease [Helicobacter anatolicus]MCE3039025.1 ABC transporter permease [Helicobacter anatolicus]